jgi:glycosyltransferase involved in cell wall biosynthesis
VGSITEETLGASTSDVQVSHQSRMNRNHSHFMTRASIIICTRNRAEPLRLTLNALCNLQLPAGFTAELLVIDSASTDHTADVIKACPFPGGIRVIREDLPGLSRARNRGVKEATGEILLFTDDDVRPPKQWVGAMCAPILAGNVSAVAGGVEIASNLLRPWMQKWHRILMASTEHLDDSAPCNLVGANMAVAREVFDRVPGFDPEIGAGALGYGEEVLFSAQILQAGFKIAYVNDATVEHHFDESRLARKSLLEAARKLGRSNAYINWHWEQKPVQSARLKLARAVARLGYYRLRRRKETRAIEGAPAWEIQLLTDVHYFSHYLNEKKRPRRYAEHGLKILTPVETPNWHSAAVQV